MRRVGATPGARLAVLAAAVALVAAAGVAYAAIPDSGGVVHGCYATRDGSLRVIDAATGQSCDPRKENALDWNVAGPQGPVGPAGPQGGVGPQGPAGPAGLGHAYEVSASGVAISTSSTPVVSASVPDGSYVVIAQLWLTEIVGPSDPEPEVVCGLSVPFSSTGTHVFLTKQQSTTFTSASGEATLVAAVTLSGGTNQVDVDCSSSDGAVDAHYANVALVKAAALN